MAIKFEDEEFDPSYCEGDPTLDDVDLDDLVRFKKKVEEISKHPRKDHRDLASVCLLAEMYGSELDVR